MDKISNETLENTIKDVLLKCGMRDSVAGFHYSICGIEYIITNSNHKVSMKTIYLEISNKFNTTPSKAERSLRYFRENPRTSEIAYKFLYNWAEKYPSAEFLYELTNKEFLIIISDIVKSILS